MLKDVGLLVNCGRWRLVREPKRGSVAINFVLSVEVLESESSEAIDELRAAIQETVASWSRAGWRKMKKQEREHKEIKHGHTR
jgi:hypothetical protein